MSRAASRSLIAWLAALSLLLGGLLPSVAQAMPAAPAFEMAICSVAGAATPEQQHGFAVHCLACCQHGQSPALPVTTIALPVRAWPAPRPVPAAFAIRTGEQPYRRARPRGPPHA